MTGPATRSFLYVIFTAQFIVKALRATRQSNKEGGPCTLWHKKGARAQYGMRAELASLLVTAQDMRAAHSEDTITADCEETLEKSTLCMLTWVHIASIALQCIGALGDTLSLWTRCRSHDTGTIRFLNMAIACRPPMRLCLIRSPVKSSCQAQFASSELDSSTEVCRCVSCCLFGSHVYDNRDYFRCGLPKSSLAASSVRRFLLGSLVRALRGAGRCTARRFERPSVPDHPAGALQLAVLHLLTQLALRHVPRAETGVAPRRASQQVDTTCCTGLTASGQHGSTSISMWQLLVMRTSPRLCKLGCSMCMLCYTTSGAAFLRSNVPLVSTAYASTAGGS